MAWPGQVHPTKVSWFSKWSNLLCLSLSYILSHAWRRPVDLGSMDPTWVMDLGQMVTFLYLSYGIAVWGHSLYGLNLCDRCLLYINDSTQGRDRVCIVHLSQHICSFPLDSGNGGPRIGLRLYHPENGLEYARKLHWIQNTLVAATKQGLGMPFATFHVHTLFNCQVAPNHLRNPSSWFKPSILGREVVWKESKAV